MSREFLDDEKTDLPQRLPIIEIFLLLYESKKKLRVYKRLLHASAVYRLT